jgi:hypothetical protein
LEGFTTEETFGCDLTKSIKYGFQEFSAIDVRGYPNNACRKKKASYKNNVSALAEH